MKKFSENSVNSGASAAINFLETQRPGTTLTIGENGLAEDLAYRTRTLPWFVSDDLIQGLTWPDLIHGVSPPKAIGY